MTRNTPIIAVMILLVFLYCQPVSLCVTKPPKPSKPFSLQSGQAKFTSALLKELESGSVGNWVVSPHSVHSAFSQVLQGAGGRTQSQLEDVLGVTQGDSLVDQYTTLSTQLSRSGGGAILKEANLLAVAQRFKLKAAYKNDLIRGFKSKIKRFNFRFNAASSVRKINRYVDENTNGKIKHLLSNGDITGLTRLILINAVYFKADWKFTFPLKSNYNEIFHTSNVKKIPTKFMRVKAKVRVLENYNQQLDILELPYSDPSKAMLIVLPKPGVSTDRIVDRMDGLDLADVRRKGRLANTIISIPKFKLRYKTFLKEKMTKLGAGDMFSKTADLSGMSNEPLYASEGVHQAFIEVNNNGTEAAAATAVLFVLYKSITIVRRFTANRPFIFVVYDFDQKVALFAGKMVNPAR